MRWSVLWTLVPDEALPLLIAAVGLAIVCGLLRGRVALPLLLLWWAVRWLTTGSI